MHSSAAPPVASRRVASVCSGAFILAAAGLLDGRRATTHWSRTAEFARRFPKVRVEPDRIHVKDGPIWTSAGITAGIDLALALIAEDLGEEIAKLTAQQLVVYYRRPGGQSQFSALLELGRPEARFGPLLSWARERLHQSLGVERLADQAAMSPRHFSRAFAAETGVTPAKAVERLRVEAARERIEAGVEPIDSIATRVGFGDPERMRRAFLRAFRSTASGSAPHGTRPPYGGALVLASRKRLPCARRLTASSLYSPRRMVVSPSATCSATMIFGSQETGKFTELAMKHFSCATW